MWTPGLGELLIIFAIVLVLFGGGKLAGVGKSLGTAISEFKSSVSDDKKEEKVPSDEAPSA
ncbi:MAG: twin-arginine translocase TatA/TatE family subunit [Candidatus Hydrogenedentes bacterium]|nr:twin-arginine translocase TatA/TatE family subunit [Candidatus Hydrogenedentota bacterium]